MLKDFLELIQDTAVKAMAAEDVNLGDPRKKSIVCNGAVSTFDVPPPLRSHVVYGFNDFSAAVEQWDAGIRGDIEGEGIVFHNRESLVLMCNDSDRRDFVTMPLVISDTFKLLRTLGGRSMDHKPFVTLLKNDLRDHAPESLLLLVRKLEVATGSRNSAEIATGRERGTREFQAELANAQELPETVNILASVYSNTGLRVNRTIRCSLDVELPQLVFKLAPLPDELEIAVENAQMEIGEMLRRALPDATVLYGKP